MQAPPAYNDHAQFTFSLAGARSEPLSKRYRPSGRLADAIFQLPSTYEDGGGDVPGRDSATTGAGMTKLIHWPLQAKRVVGSATADWIGDLRVGMILFVRRKTERTTFRDGMGEKRSYNQFDQRLDVFALHQLNAVLHRLALGFDGVAASRTDPCVVFDEFGLAGVLTTDITESGRGSFSILNCKVQGDMNIANVFGIGDANDHCQLVVKMVPVPEESMLVTFSAKNAVPQRIANYHRATRERVPFMTQIVPMLTPTRHVPAKYVTSVLDYGDRLRVVVQGRVYTLGQVWYTPDFNDSARLVTKDNSYYFAKPPKEFSDGAKNAKAVLGCGNITIKVNVG